MSRVKTGAEPSTVGWVPAIPNLLHPGYSRRSGIGVGSIPWILCPAQPGFEVPESTPKSFPNLKLSSHQTPFALEHIIQLPGIRALCPGPAVS